MTPTVRIRLLPHAVAAPRYATPGAAGADLTAALDPKLTLELEPGARARVETGIAIALPEGWEAQIRPRSGLAQEPGLTILNAPGTIDADYRGEIQVLLINHGHQIARIRRGDRIAQMVIAPAPQATFIEVETLDETERGAGGFGSTGRGA